MTGWQRTFYNIHARVEILMTTKCISQEKKKKLFWIDLQDFCTSLFIMHCLNTYIPYDFHYWQWQYNNYFWKNIECRKLNDQYQVLEFNIFHSCEKNPMGEKGKCCLLSTHWVAVLISKWEGSGWMRWDQYKESRHQKCLNIIVMSLGEVFCLCSLLN